ncbi:MAG TPA: hypothetical protein PLN56_10295 [Methanoregulaceae archaeon]|nr:hypothetical protein [Methanoregulaceae archaeon]
MILIVICLFLCVLNALILFELRKRLRKRGDRSSETMAVKTEPEIGVLSTQPCDLESGIRLAAGRYHLDSLVIGTVDGLVVSSHGSRNPEYEAAYYSNILREGVSAPERGVRPFAFKFRDTPLIAIARARETPSEEVVSRLETDIRTVLETQL